MAQIYYHKQLVNILHHLIGQPSLSALLGRVNSAHFRPYISPLVLATGGIRLLCMDHPHFKADLYPERSLSLNSTEI